MTSIICRVAGHRAASDATYNGGFHFSRCRRCRVDLIRSGGNWRGVPRGHRVVWTTGRRCHSIEPDYERVMGVLVEQARLPTVKPAFLSWSRQLARRFRPKAPSRGEAAVAAEARGDAQYPTLLVIAALFAAGVQMLLGLGGRTRDYA